MKFTMHCYDHAGQKEIRAGFNQIHKAHLEKSAAYGVKVLIAGPLLASADEDDRMGALFIVETDHQSQALKFFQEDPFWKNGVWNPNTVKIDALKLSINSFL